MVTVNKTEGPEVYQIKVSLKEISPLIWRRIQVTGDTTLNKLHRIMQLVMGWQDYHLHQFIIRGRYYGQPAMDETWDDLTEKDQDDKKVRLNHVVLREKTRFIYEYDFGDGWEHEVLIEKILPRGKGMRYPVCVAGERACPPEDCGGIRGYADLLRVIRNPRHREHKRMLEWVGGSFDPEAFDVGEVNRELKTIK